MSNKLYYKNFKEEMERNNIIVDLDNNGFFRVLSNKTDFTGLSTEEPIGLLHILNYDYMKLNDDLYRLIRRLESFTIEELERELEEDLFDEDDID